MSKKTVFSKDHSLDADVFNKENPSPYLRKHRKSILAFWAITHPELVRKQQRIFMATVALFSLSIFVNIANFFILKTPIENRVYGSLSNKKHDIISLTTMPWAVLTPPTIEKWATTAISNILSVSFINFDEHLSKIKPYFTEGGYAGIVEAFNKGYRNQLVNGQENMVTVTNGPSRMTHYPNKLEKWFTVEVPIISSFDNGNQKTISSRQSIASIIIQAAAGDSAEYGKAIGKITIE